MGGINQGFTVIFLTTLSLSITSNIISNIILFYITKLIDYNDYLNTIVKDVSEEHFFLIAFKKYYKALLIKVYFYCIISFILIIFMSLYLIIFFQIHKKTQNSLLINYLMSLLESLAYSVCISFIVSVLRIIGIKYQSKHIYRISVYMDSNL